MSLMTTQDCQSFSRSVRKIKVASTNVSNGWQSWTKEHKGKQDTISSGCLPDPIIPEKKVKETEKSKRLVTPCVFTVSNQVSGDCMIKNVMVEKDMPKDCEQNHHLVSCIKEKIHIHQAASGEPVIFTGNNSLNTKHHRGGKTVRQEEEQKMWSYSSSLNAEDSGLEEDASQSDNDQTDMKKNKPINRPQIKVTTIGDLRNKWQKFAEEHVEGQKLNPFSDDFDYNHAMAVRLHKGEVGYGHPKEGSKTAERAERAKKHIYREMDEMCHIIRIIRQRNKNGHICVTFGRLFDHYAKISDKVVGILLRCRKYNMVDFEGEMLWQGQDDDVQIKLLV